MFVTELRKAAKSSKWVRFPLPAHVKDDPRISPDSSAATVDLEG